MPEETARGLDDREDHLFAALFSAKLNVGASVTVVASTEATTSLDVETARAERSNYEVKLFNAWQKKNGALTEEAPSWLWQLVLAADQFVVQRSLPQEPDGRSIIAGYHWFGDWGRDTMIALPGLTLATGREDVARQILLAFSRYVDGGMLPNNFPDSGASPEYNTVDAALWYFEAVRQYFDATQDAVTLQKLFPVLAGMIDAHVKGTRYNIHVDSSDGLLYAGVPGVQLTWMDAKVGDWVVTPRSGKPVEIQALWYNALRVMEDLAQRFGDESGCKRYRNMATLTHWSFNHLFWNDRAGCLYDVVNGAPPDPTIRPNQIFAISLPHSMLSQERAVKVVEVVERDLLTAYGLRSLSPSDTRYRGRYEGGVYERDSSYHQGPVWPWLMGPFITAYVKVKGRGRKAREHAAGLLAGFHTHLKDAGIGQISEILDGDAPHTPRGCVAQAWSVAEILRATAEDVLQVKKSVSSPRRKAAVAVPSLLEARSSV